MFHYNQNKKKKVKTWFQNRRAKYRRINIVTNSSSSQNNKMTPLNLQIDSTPSSLSDNISQSTASEYNFEPHNNSKQTIENHMNDNNLAAN